MMTQTTTQKAQTTRRGALLLGLGVGVALAGASGYRERGVAG
jgi:hypothetical protein